MLRWIRIIRRSFTLIFCLFYRGINTISVLLCPCSGNRPQPFFILFFPERKSPLFPPCSSIRIHGGLLIRLICSSQGHWKKDTSSLRAGVERVLSENTRKTILFSRLSPFAFSLYWWNMKDPLFLNLFYVP